MKRALQISISNKPKTASCQGTPRQIASCRVASWSGGGIAAVRSVPLREKFMRHLFGDKTHVTVIVPGDTVEELAIKEIGKEDNA